MRTGRPRKPTAIKILEGNRGKRPLPDDEPQPRQEIPTCPRSLGKEARREWRRIVPELTALGLLTLVDRAALAGYCAAYGRWCQAEEALKAGLTCEWIDKNGNSHVVARPEVAIARDALIQVKSFCTEFGLTPSSRSRMHVPGKEEEGGDPLEAILKRHQKN